MSPALTDGWQEIEAITAAVCRANLAVTWLFGGLSMHQNKTRDASVHVCGPESSLLHRTFAATSPFFFLSVIFTHSEAAGGRILFIFPHSSL